MTVQQRFSDFFLFFSLEGESTVANQIGLDNNFEFFDFAAPNSTLPVNIYK